MSPPPAARGATASFSTGLKEQGRGTQLHGIGPALYFSPGSISADQPASPVPRLLQHAVHDCLSHRVEGTSRISNHGPWFSFAIDRGGTFTDDVRCALSWRKVRVMKLLSVDLRTMMTRHRGHQEDVAGEDRKNWKQVVGTPEEDVDRERLEEEAMKEDLVELKKRGIESVAVCVGSVYTFHGS
ncbi:unnamed protein product [Chrysodeixis includens]|uniref:Hydantoinase/oxoprolinase N-terminal domain-containing protein n=1 Tax=Chrysodeixis includens TaxID=689277 RepID=A0A9N8Q0I1_CHRIL|nr:unnamed protein product [Chrysodeixis includens]